MPARRGRIVRLVAAVMLALLVFAVLPSVSSADTEAQLAAARARYDQLNRDMEVLVEEYNGARVRRDQLRTQHAEILAVKQEAEENEAAAIRALTARAQTAYTDSGSQLESLLGSGDFADFSDRLEFINQLAAQDADLAARAESAAQRAAWAAGQLEQAEAEQARLLAELEAKQVAIESSLAEHRALVDQLGAQLAAEREAARQAAAEEAAAQRKTPPGAEAAGTGATGTGGEEDTSGGGRSNGHGGGGGPPPVGSGARAAVAAAYSVLGTKYVWGGASTSGFDCSGLTMWAWARGGVSLPHHSASQYAATPRVSRSQLQPGDLVFFYSPISHVGLYIGGNQMIDATHPGPSGKVAVRTLFSGYVGAGRPG